MSHFSHLVAACVVVAIFDESSFAGTISVPVDVSTIQGAIDSAVAGDVVLVSPGTYFENIDFKGKAIEVRSSGGPSVTTIDGGGLDSVVRFRSGEPPEAILDGFTLTNGFGPGQNYPYDGGGISCHNGSAPTIRNNIIEHNGAASGGGGGGAGGISCDASSPRIERNQIRNNNGVGAGGVMTYAGASPLIIDCVIASNSSTSLGWGGGIQCSFSSPIVVNTVIAFNSANYDGGGIQHGHNAAAQFINCVIWDNSCPLNGGISVYLSTIELWNCVIRSNDATQIQLTGAASAITHSCNIEGGWGATDFDLDPMFVDAANGDFHVQSSSACVDSGDSTAPNLPTTDVDGDPRVWGVTVDVGIDEVTRHPLVTSVTPHRRRYDAGGRLTVDGSGFAGTPPPSVRFGTLPATNVTVLDDSTLTCDLPLGEPGPVEVGVANSYGEGVLVDGFIYSPALLVTGDPVLGGTLTLDFYCDSLNAIYAIAGFPPAVSLQTKPFDGTLCIDPSYLLFWVPLWPFDQFSLQVDIPNDSSLSGMTLLSQALIGPRLGGRNKDGAWTNCVTVTIQ